MQMYNAQLSVSDVRYAYLLDSLPLFFEEGHFLYPADDQGNHLLQFLLIEPLLRCPDAINMIVGHLRRWVNQENITCDVVFAPAQPGVKEITRGLASSLGCRHALWEYLPTGRFGNTLVEGNITSGDQTLIFNGVSQQGRCVGQRLPEFARRYGARIEAVAVFAKGSTGLVHEVERQYGSRFFSAIQADIPVYKREECPTCLEGDTASLQPWTDLLK